MPGKMLFGRMRPEVIEARVIGLNQFLQQVLALPQFACPDLVDFLERERNMPRARALSWSPGVVICLFLTNHSGTTHLGPRSCRVKPSLLCLFVE